MLPGPAIASWLPNGRYEGALPAIQGQFNIQDDDTYCVPATSGVFATDNAISRNVPAAAIRQMTVPTTVDFNALRSSGVYNRQDNGVIPTGVAAMAIIKY